MNIYIVAEYYYPDNFKINDMASEFVKRGNNVTTLTGLPDYEKGVIPKEYRFFRKRHEIIDGAYVNRVSTVSRRSGAFFRILTYLSFAVNGFIYLKVCKRPDADVIFVSQSSPVTMAVPAFSLRKRIKKPVVLYCMDIWPEVLKAWDIKESSLMFKISKKISAYLYKNCDLVLISSEPFKMYLKDLGVDESKIVYLPQYAEDLYENICGKYIENGVIDFVFAGNIGAVQDIECIIHAVKYINENQPVEPYMVHIVGDGINLNDCKKLADSLGVNSNIIFHGRYPLGEMERFYNLADCFLLTLRGGDSISMTLPGKVQSYLSVGKPVVGAIDGAAKQMIENSDCGICVPGSDFEQLGNAMYDVIKNFDSYKEKGINGRKYYENNYTKEKFMVNLFKVFESLV